MLLDHSLPSTLPQIPPNTLYSFSPYPVTSRSYLHNALQTSISIQLGRPGPSTYNHAPEKRALERAALRALAGRRPTGVALGREADELSDEEKEFDAERAEIDTFGHRFLLPFGRRQTQMEVEALNHTPEPSEPDHERRQEDNGASSPVPIAEGAGAGEEEEDEDEDEVDLDASLEDMDNSGGDLEEGDSFEAEGVGEGEDMEED